jgi:stage V sporulation protein G
VSPAKGGKVRAFVSIVLDDCFIVNDIRVIEGREGQLLVSMPARKTRNGQVRDTAHPLNADTRKMIDEKVLSEYQEAEANRIIPARSSAHGSARGKDKMSTLDRVASKLFVEEFWAPDVPNRDGADT